MVFQRRRTWVASGLALAVIMTVMMYPVGCDREQPEPELMSEAAPAAAAPSAATNPVEHIPSSTIAAAEDPALQPLNPTAHAEVSQAWQVGDTFTDSTFALPAGVIVYATVVIDMEKPYYPQPGEQLELPLPGDFSVRVNVSSSHPNPNGDYSWRGHLEGYGNDYPVVMTYGQNSVFATVTTPQGSYTLESINGRGWIYKNPAEIELSAPGATDYLEIPHSHPHH